MRRYLMALEQFADQGADTISSWQLSERVGVKAALIRKDLSHFGGFGTPSAGYQVNYLKRQISDIMRLNETRGVIWLGAKKLREQSEAIATMTHHNRHLVAVLDSDPKEVGSRVMDVEVQHIDALHRTVEALAPDVAVIAIPDEDAQKAASILVRGGVNAILNLTSTLLVVPAHVNIRSIDISGELLALSYYSSRDSR
jgi:redox-sensing transcriptional repressor